MKKSFQTQNRFAVGARLSLMVTLFCSPFLRAQEDAGIEAAKIEAIREAIASGAIPAEAAAGLLSELAPDATEGNATSKGRDDYQAAFEKLVALGLPDAAGAQYVKLTFAQTDEEPQMFYQRYSLERAGNAWLLPQEDPKSPARQVIHDGVRTEKVASKEKRNLIVRLFAGEDNKDRDGVRKAEWTEVDPVKEADDIIRQLKEDSELAPLFDRERWSYDSESMTLLGDLLITACHFHRAGHQEAGNKLARHLLTRAPYPFRVIDLAVSKLANHEYQTLLEALYENQDWRAFLAGIRTLRSKYPRGWDLQPGLGILVPQVVDFLAKGPLPLEPYQDTPLDPEIVKTLDGILEPSGPGATLATYTPACWVINPQGELESEYGPSGPPAGWLTGIVDKGMEAFPTLVAASADPTLIPAPHGYPGSSSFGGFSSFSSGNESPDEAAFKKMPRPTSRGEIARAILLRTLPSGSIPWSALAPEDFQIAAHQWWTDHQDLSASEIAVLFLQDGDGEQNGIALQALLKSKDPSSFEIIEEHILSSDSAMSSVDLARQYLRIRRGQGKEFYEAFIEAFEAEIAEFSNGGSNDDQFKEFIEQTKQSLSVLVDEVSPEKLMTEMSSGQRSVEEGFAMLRVALGEENIRSKHDLLVPFIAGLPEPADRLLALQTLQQWTTNERPPEVDATNAEASRKEALAIREHWATLLSRQDSLDLDAEVLGQYENPPSEAHYAASVMNALYFTDSFPALNALRQVADLKELWPLFLDRMKTFLETEKAPPLPAASEVGPDRRKALISHAQDLGPTETISWRNSLELPERLAFMEAVSGLESLPDNLAALSRVCQKIDWSSGGEFPEKTRREIEALILNRQVSGEFIASLRRFLSSLEDDAVFYFGASQGQLGGPRIFIGGNETASQWASSMVAGERAKLDGDPHESLIAFAAFGLGDQGGLGNGQPQTAVLFEKPFDSAKEKEAFDVLVEKTLPLFEPSDEEDNQYIQRGFAIASIHFEKSEDPGNSDSE